MKKLGMIDAFSQNADFSEMSDVESFVSYIMHKTRIEVDEKGTKAAAVTASGLCGAAAPPQRITLDSPFIYVISEYSTGAILFMGVLNSVE